MSNNSQQHNKNMRSSVRSTNRKDVVRSNYTYIYMERNQTAGYWSWVISWCMERVLRHLYLTLVFAWTKYQVCINSVYVPSKHKKYVWHSCNVGPTSKTLGRRCIKVIQMFCVCCNHRVVTIRDEYTGLQKWTAVTANFKSNQLVLVVKEKANSSNCLLWK